MQSRSLFRAGGETRVSDIAAFPGTGRRGGIYSVEYTHERHYTSNIGSEMNCHFIWYLYNELCVLYPRAFGEGL